MQTDLTNRVLGALALGLLLLGAASVRGQIVFDFSTSNQSWTAAVQSGSYDFDSPIGPFLWGTPSDGGGNAWYTDGVDDLDPLSQATGDIWTIKTLTSPTVTVQSSGSVTITLSHRYNFESDNTDGGQLRYRVNGGSWTLATGFSSGGYNSTQINAFVLASETDDDGWVSTSSGFGSQTSITSTVTIAGLNANDTLQLQLRGGWDDSSSPSGPDWVIKEVQVTNVVPEPRVYALACALGLLGYGLWRRVQRERLSPKPSSATPTATP